MDVCKTRILQWPELPPTHTHTHTTPSHLQENILGYLTISILQYLLNLVRHKRCFRFSPSSLTSSYYWQTVVFRVSLTVKCWLVQTFQKLSQNIWWAGEQSISILFHACRDAQEHCVLVMRLTQGNSNGISFTRLKPSIKKWLILTKVHHKQPI